MKIPDIATGKVISLGVQEKILKEEAKKKAEKKQFWINILINVLCIGLGALLDNIADICQWLIKILT